MEDSSNYLLNMLVKKHPELASIKDSIYSAYEILAECFSNNHKILICGNGGSASDSEHIVGELMKGFKLERSIDDSFKSNLLNIDEEFGQILCDSLQGCLPAISLTSNYSLNTALINDSNPYITFAQQVFGYGDKNDVLFAISTSGNSKNVLLAAITAKAKGMKVISLTGHNGGKIKKYSDIAICVPLSETYLIQEEHLPIYHCLCLMLEEKFFTK